MALLKLTADLAAQEQDMFFTYDELIAEVCVGLNSLLIWHGVVPIQGVTGSGGTLDLVDQADDTPLDGMDDTSDMCERAILLRHNAKIAVIKALIEQRVARANRAHKQDTKVTKVGQIVDLYRRPATKDFPGWKGPGVVLELNDTDGTAIVRWQGRPWLMAPRRLRPHEGYCPTTAAGYAASTYLACSATSTEEASPAIDHMVEQLMRLQDKVDGATPGKLQSYGRVYDTRRNRWTTVATKPELASMVRTEARYVAVGALGGFHFGPLRATAPRGPAAPDVAGLGAHVRAVAAGRMAILGARFRIVAASHAAEETRRF